MKTRSSLPLLALLLGLFGLLSEGQAAAPQDGSPWSWGYNGYGQLGDGTTELSNVPIEVSGLSEVVSVSGGLAHSVALKSDGTVWSWGLNSVGQLGNGTTSDSPSLPVEVAGIDRVIAVSAGIEHSIALKSDGTVWGWGGNRFGQLGNGSSDDSSIPVQVAGLDRITNVAAGGYRNLARRSDGTFWTWGTPGLGGAGFERETTRGLPVQVQGPVGVVDVAVGIDHSLALKDGLVYAWGLNRYGQLGDGSNVDSPDNLVLVKGLKDIVALGAGSYHSLATTKTGNVWAWGWNGSGQLGNGTTTDSPVPVQVKGLSGVSAVAAGWYHSMALTRDGTVWVWGDNLFGKLGDGSFRQSAVPQKLTSIGKALGIGAGADYSLAVKAPPTPTPIASRSAPRRVR